MKNPIGSVLPSMRSGLAGILVAGMLLALPASAMAQDASTEAPAEGALTPDTVVATVGGEAITEADVAFAAEDMQQDLAQMPPEERKPFLVTMLIDMKVMAKVAREGQLDQTDIFKRRLKYLEDRALRRAFFAERIAASVTDEAVQAAYDALVAGFTPEDELRASHILVASKEDADAIKAELATGKPFADLAKEKSIDPSAAQNGGDLGYFSRGMMVQPFEEAAFGLADSGQVSEPVESQFGWHVIRLEDKRQSQPPALDAVRPQLEQQVMFEAFQAAVGTLKDGLTIDIPDAALAAGVQRRMEQQSL